jgi:hypothetical protein
VFPLRTCFQELHQKELVAARIRQSFSPEAAAFEGLERKLDELESEARGRDSKWRSLLEEHQAMAEAQLEMTNQRW